jgi:hypothetical protein
MRVLARATYQLMTRPTPSPAKRETGAPRALEVFMRLRSAIGLLTALLTGACAAPTVDDTTSSEAVEPSASNEALTSAAHLVDVTAITGQKAIGPFTSWQTRKGTVNEEHLAGRSPTGDALVFAWTPAQNRVAENLTLLTGQKIASKLTAWQVSWTEGTVVHNVEHIAGMAPNGDNVLFYRSDTSSVWKLVNVTQKTNQKIAGALTSWVTPGGVEHLAGRSPNGDLIVFWWSNQHDWQAINVTQTITATGKTGDKIAESVTSWQTPNGSANVEHLAGRNPNGDLIVFWWSSGGNWQSVNVSQKTGIRITSDVTAWKSSTGRETIEHLAAVGPGDALVTFAWQPTWDWHAYSISNIAGGTVAGAPVAYDVPGQDEQETHIAVRTKAGGLATYATKPSVDWRAFDVTGAIASTPEGWLTPDGAGQVEHVAFEGSGQRVLLYWETVKPLTNGPNVLTQHNDRGRTGASLTETTLTTSNVSSQRFGKLFERSVDGQMYAQPLYLANANMGRFGRRNVVFLATENNSVYAYDADDPSASEPLWSRSYGNAVPILSPFPRCVDMKPLTGITSTPVIELGTNTIYVETKSLEGAFTNDNAYHHRLHALDLSTGIERPNSPVEITGSVPGNGPDTEGGRIPFRPKMHHQRSSLLLSNGVLYVAFGAHCDINPYHGWVFAYDPIRFTQLALWNTTPNLPKYGGEGGIWQSGQGPAADHEGRPFLMTGNGTWDGVTDFGDSFVKVGFSNSGFGAVDWFTPHNEADLQNGDTDLGVSGPMLVPGTKRLVGGGKESKFYVMDRAGMGGFHAGDDSQLPQVIPNATAGHIHGSPVYWKSPAGGTVYVWSENDKLRAYRWSGGQFVPTTPISQSTYQLPDEVMPGAMLSVSANGSTAGTGIVWANMPFSQNANWETVPGILRAYDAEDLSRELWNSRQNTARDDFGNFAKFAAPTVANGKVYLSTFSNKLTVYGQLPCVPRTTCGLTCNKTVADGCGGTFYCGTCENPEAICKANRCVIDRCAGLDGQDLICCRKPTLPVCRFRQPQ